MLIIVCLLTFIAFWATLVSKGNAIKTISCITMMICLGACQCLYLYVLELSGGPDQDSFMSQVMLPLLICDVLTVYGGIKIGYMVCRYMGLR